MAKRGWQHIPGGVVFPTLAAAREAGYTRGDLIREGNDIEQRPLKHISPDGVNTMGRAPIMVECPFCETETATTEWSFAGTGRRCHHCRAMLSLRGCWREVERPA